MKVLFLNNHGSRIPALVRKYITPDHSWRWGNVIKELEDKSVLISADVSKGIKSDIVRYHNPDASVLYLFREENITVKVVDVDISRPWCIETYDGAEYLQYLDYEPIHPEYNLHRLPKC